MLISVVSPHLVLAQKLTVNHAPQRLSIGPTSISHFGFRYSPDCFSFKAIPLHSLSIYRYQPWSVSACSQSAFAFQKCVAASHCEIAPHGMVHLPSHMSMETWLDIARRAFGFIMQITRYSTTVSGWTSDEA